MSVSIGVAVTGICPPIALSFVLHNLLGATPLQAFAAGAALCSTSLGTTFTVLSASGLSKTRLGVVLTSAAMMDDVVGLVMVQVISNLSASTSAFQATTVIRPVFVSLAFAILVPLFCWLVVVPVIAWLRKRKRANVAVVFQEFCASDSMYFVTHIAVLLVFVTGGSYAGTSNLFTAYLAGACISWWDSTVDDSTKHGAQGSSGQEFIVEARTETAISHLTGVQIYETYFKSVVDKVLKPLFFATIGFSIPITKMFEASVLWRGLVYTCLMMIGKLLCGLWLVPFSPPSIAPTEFCWTCLSLVRKLFCRDKAFKGQLRAPVTQPTEPTADHLSQEKCSKLKKTVSGPAQQGNADSKIPTPNGLRDEMTSAFPQHQEASKQYDPPANEPTSPVQINKSNDEASDSKPTSLYPAAIIANAMVARGEIGFLISSIAESRGIFGSRTESSETFLVVTWAVMLCTIIGPLIVGLLVRRVKRLQKTRHQYQAEWAQYVLGDWGVQRAL